MLLTTPLGGGSISMLEFVVVAIFLVSVIAAFIGGQKFALFLFERDGYVCEKCRK